MRSLRLALAGITALALTACAQLGIERPRTDSVASACNDIGVLFGEGLAARAAGLAGAQISARIAGSGLVDQATADLITGEVLAQTVPRASSQLAPFILRAQRTMTEACARASGAEAVLDAVAVRPVPKPS